MNIKKIAPIITTKITQVIKSGEVLEGKIKTGMMPSVRTLACTKEEFQKYIPNLEKVRAIHIGHDMTKSNAFSDTYVVKEQNKILKLIVNYKTNKTTYCTTIMNNLGEKIKKITARVPQAIKKGEVSDEHFAGFLNAYQDANKIFVTFFSKNKPRTCFASLKLNPGHSGETRVQKELVNKSKPTALGYLLKDFKKNPDSFLSGDFLLNKVLKNKNPVPLTIIQRPLKNGKTVWTALQKGSEPIIETLQVNPAIFKKEAKNLVETREIYLGSGLEEIKTKAFDVFTLKNEESRIKIIKDYRKQKIKVITDSPDSSGNTSRTVYQFLPKEKMCHKNCTHDSLNEIITIIENDSAALKPELNLQYK